MDVTKIPINGLTITAIEQDGTITFTDGSMLVMWHAQDCCESVDIHEIVTNDVYLSGAMILDAEIVEDGNLPAPEDMYPNESQLWTFYKFQTTKGPLTISWFGSSNGYYSVRVCTRHINETGTIWEDYR